jgi:hypothetical protein
MMLRFAVATLILCASCPAIAQAEPDPAAMAAARDLLSSVDLERQVAETVVRTSEAVIDTIMRRFRDEHGEAFPEDLERQMREIVQAHNLRVITLMTPTLLDDSARIYARHFTAYELRELQRLQAHPVMQKSQRVAPQLFAELSQVGMGAAVAMQPELQRDIQQAVENWIASNASAPAT